MGITASHIAVNDLIVNDFFVFNYQLPQHSPMCSADSFVLKSRQEFGT